MSNKLLVLLLILNYSFGYRNYENYKVFTVTPITEEQVKILTKINSGDIDIWSKVVIDRNVSIMVAPNKVEYFLEHTRRIELSPKITNHNVQELIDNQLKSASTQQSNILGSLTFEHYHTLDDIYAWLDELHELYPDVVTIVNMGTSFAGRMIKGVIIDYKPGERGNFPRSAMIEGGIHAREWISPSTVTWIIKELLTSNDPEVRTMAENFAWHIFPVTNPDGYVYSFTSDRMWRKNRNTMFHTNCSHVGEDDDLSNGVDLNRNFDYLWMSIGASDDPCTLIYAGPFPSSEPETTAIVKYVLKLRVEANLIYYISFHSTSQWIMIPQSMSSGQDVLETSNFADMYEVAIRGAEKLTAKHGTKYEVGTLRQILEHAELSGSSFDWVKGVTNVAFVYLFELRDQGEYSFLLPPEQIIPNHEEIMECLLEMDRTVRKIGYYADAASVVNSIILITSASGLLLLQYIF